MKYIHLVMVQSNSCEDFRERIVKAFESEKDALNYRAFCIEELKKLITKGEKLMSVEGIEDDIGLWSRQYDKWIKRKNNYDPDWEPIDNDVEYYVFKIRLVFTIIGGG